MTRQTTVAFVSLGCVKNLVDSEKMLGQLAEAGCAVTNDESAADVIAHCGRYLAPFKTPKEIRFIDELPRNARGKLDREVLVTWWERESGGPGRGASPASTGQ